MLGELRKVRWSTRILKQRKGTAKNDWYDVVGAVKI